MTVTQLECFRAVARRRHFARAADSLGKTQPALTVHVQRLEADLGVRLLERSGRQVLLTPAGEILLPYAEKILADTAEARVRMAEVHGGTLGVVRIGVIPTIAAHFLPAVFKEFKSRFPQVTVLLREESTTPLLTSLLQSGEVDLCIALRPLTSTGLKPRTLFTEEFCLAVSLQHALSAQSIVPIARLKKEKFILYKTPGHNTRETTLQYCRSAGFEPEVAFESEQAETIQSLVASNLGLSLLPEMVLRQPGGQSLAMVRIQAPTPRRTVVATWRPGRYLSNNARQFLQCAESVAAQWESKSKAIRANTAGSARH
ncbi:MAG TPA: LysR substrate-binding domain-containing protein [Bryobacteraceae bacterium]|nr:LysR substrate-binding domain-containing protein [Bryobacteraceae bacterium]